MEHRKMDRRMTGHQDFEFCATFFKTVKESQKFCDIREWCWETWGPSCEYDIWTKRTNRNQHWCWANDEFKMKIYFKTDKEDMLFILRWI